MLCVNSRTRKFRSDLVVVPSHHFIFKVYVIWIELVSNPYQIYQWVKGNNNTEKFLNSIRRGKGVVRVIVRGILDRGTLIFHWKNYVLFIPGTSSICSCITFRCHSYVSFSFGKSIPWCLSLDRCCNVFQTYIYLF